MRYFDDIAPPDSAFVEGRWLPRITVRPKGVEPSPEPGNAQASADASNGTDNALPARTGGFFDDIVPPRPGHASRAPADASGETDNTPPARTGLFDDIVPPVDAAASNPPRQNGIPERKVPLSPQATGSIAAPTEGDIPYYDPMTGIPMSAPQLPPHFPGLPVRPETQAPLNTPPSGWHDLPLTAPRFGVPLAVPDPNALGEGFPAAPGPTALDRIKAAAAHGFGDEPLGFSQESRAKYPHTYLRWQPYAAPLDFALRAPGAAIGAISSAGSEIYKALGGTETDANRLERDLNILGQSAMVEGGFGSRYNIGKPQTNLFRTTEGALSNEAAAAPRGTIAATVSPAPLRQILAEASEQSVPSPRAGPQPPARPPDKGLFADRDKPSDRLDVAKTTTKPRPSGGVFDSGKAVWNLGWAARGKSIEQALGRSPDLHYAYPTIDRFSNGVATSIKSIDLSAPTYQDTRRLAATLNKLVDDVAAFRGGHFAGVRIHQSQIAARELQLAVPSGRVSSAQQAALDAAATRARSVGVGLIVTPFP
jgi:hypothetical protein